MATRTSAVKQLLDRTAAKIGKADWKVVGGNRLRAKLDDGIEGVILFFAAGYVNFTVSIEVGPRFPAIEKIVRAAGRSAGLPESHFKTASAFPTVFQRLNRISSLPDHTPLSAEAEIIEALERNAVPFMIRISSIGAAADYALTNGLAFGHHAMRIPVLLFKAGRRDEADRYMDAAVNAEGLYSEFLARYRAALTDLI